jgi:hypothetical protein
MEEYKREHCCCCFESFIKNKCLLCVCIAMIFIYLAVVTVIPMAIMVIILMAWTINKKIHYMES